ncbi:HAD family hydrolase [Anaerovorax odorimutans]|uniref:HAD family hydrolase n=1 Tax=Anaerovorax odorimutans TaxID=109327 RepID=A0ABT1RPW0_9FIRM|nr:HAD family hydrolase [Anaerovorax odorimutans]MCQ4637232.1 HAD family hydrolase [Anaerovorax odorimutans]
MIDTIIFDMDGTLLDTLEDLTDATNAGLACGGYPARTVEEVRHFVGNGVRHLMMRAVPQGTSQQDMEKCLAAFKDFYAHHWQDKTRAYDGIPQLLAALRKKGIKTAVISNKYEQAVLELCRDYFPGSFDAARGQREDVPLKPAPDSVFSILEELGSGRSRAIYVGDSEVDMDTAHNAGLISVGVTWGFRDRELLAEKEADYIIDRPEELLEVLSRLNG